MYVCDFMVLLFLKLSPIFFSAWLMVDDFDKRHKQKLGILFEQW